MNKLTARISVAVCCCMLIVHFGTIPLFTNVILPMGLLPVWLFFLMELTLFPLIYVLLLFWAVPSILSEDSGPRENMPGQAGI